MTINPWETMTGTTMVPRVERRVPLEPVDEPEFFADTVPAALGYQYSPILNKVRNSVVHGTEVQQGYNALEDMDGYEEYKHHLMNAVSEDHMQDLKMQLNENKKRRQVLADSSFWANLGAGVFDPINLVALPFGGAAATVGRQFLRTGAGVGVTQVGLEAARAPFDPLSTPSEIATNIGSAFVIGGAIGSLLSVPARRRGAAIKKTEAEVTEFANEVGDITPDQIRNINNPDYRTFKDKKQSELNNFEKIFPKERDLLESKLQKAKEKANVLFKKASDLREQVKKNPALKAKNTILYKKAKEQYDAANVQVKMLEKATAQKRVDVEKVKEEQLFRRVEEVKDIGGDVSKPFDFADNFFTDSWAFKGVTTGFKRVLQDKEIPQSVKSTMVRLAGDAGMLFKMNQMGFATPKSVYQYAETRNGEWLQVYTKMLTQFGEHSGKGVTQVGDVNLSNIDGSFSAYLKEVNRKYINGEEASTTAEKESIQALHKFYKTWEDRLVEQGIIGSIKSIEAKMDNIRFKIQRKEKTLLDAQIKIIEKAFSSEEARRWISKLRRKKINQGDVVRLVKSPLTGELPKGVPDYLIDVINDSNTRLSALEDQLYELEFSMLVAKEERTLPQNEELMFPRYWNRDQIREKRQEFAAILKEHYKENPYIYERNEAAFAERRIRNISELTDAEIQARFGEEFNMVRITSDFRSVQDGPIGQQGGGSLGMFVRYADDGRQEVYLDSTGIYQYYNEIAEAMKNPSKAFKDLDATRSKTSEDYAHRKFVMRNWSFFQTFNDFQDFVLFHELHHNKFNRRSMGVKTEADQLRMENATDRAALAFLKEKLPEIREGQPVYFKRRLDVEDERMLNKRVEDTIDNILGLADTANDMNAYYGAGKSKHMRHRSLDIPNAKVFDFIQNDPLAVMRAYTTRVAPQYEFSKMFGGKSVDEVLDDKCS